LQNKTFEFSCDQGGQRLDIFLASLEELILKNISRSQIKQLVTANYILVNGKPALKSGLELRSGDLISLTLPQESNESQQDYDFELKVMYEDSELIVIDKPFGLTVHPGANTRGQTLLNALISYYHKSSAKLPAIFNSAQKDRAGIVHRLDKDTSGLLVCAKTLKSLQSLTKQFADRTIERRYQALVLSNPRSQKPVNVEDQGLVDLPVGRDPKRRVAMGVGGVAQRQAKTLWKVLERFTFATLLECQLMTGRTHQIRVHMNAIGSPVIGDKTYGDFAVLPTRLKRLADSFGRQALHAKTLGFIHPGTNQKISFSSELPQDFQNLILEFSKSA
jgi:23S rRNA pseudouridine1911/1915/1917 synthase